MILPDFLTQDSDGDIRLTGHRIGVLHLVHHYNEGYSPEMLLAQYPTLPLSLIHKVIGFYLDHQTEVNEYIASVQVDLDQQRASSKKHLNVAQLRQRLEAMQRAEKL